MVEIKSNKKYPIGVAAELVGYSRQHFLKLAKDGFISYTTTRRTKRKMFSGMELIKFINS